MRQLEYEKAKLKKPLAGAMLGAAAFRAIRPAAGVSRVVGG